MSHPAELSTKGLVPKKGSPKQEVNRVSCFLPRIRERGRCDFSVCLHTSSWGRPWAKPKLDCSLGRH